MKAIEEYRKGGEGFVEWCEDYVWIPVYPEGSMIPIWTPISDLPGKPHPETGRSPKSFWERMSDQAVQALAMDRDVFRYRLIVFCWMRGEAKSALTCLIQLWKFFTFPAQLITLGANSRDQVKFVHFDIMRDIILNSPKLLKIVGKKNLQEKEIRLRDRSGTIKSTIRSISSFSGIVSNITGYTFSEIFDLKNPKFFYQLDGSIRNIPNALGIIDSTVSAKDHVLSRLYRIWKAGKDPSLFFSHRESPNADHKDFWHPSMTQKQLNSYRIKFPPQEFNQYFKNTWSSGSKRLFAPSLVYATRYMGYGRQLGMQSTVVDTLKECIKLKKTIHAIDQGCEASASTGMRESMVSSVKRKMGNLIPISRVYTLKNGDVPRMAAREELASLTHLYDTDWAVLVGIDRSDPLAKNPQARTIVAALAKGLAGSKSDPTIMYNLGSNPYIYFVLHLAHIVSADIKDIKLELAAIHSEFDGIEAVGGERWGLWDLSSWCEENDIKFTPISPTQARQQEAFTEVYQLYKSGLLKSPPTGVAGSRQKDILVEEALYFDYNARTKVYGSPEKGDRYGVQDDCMFALGWGVWCGMSLNVEDFRPRTAEMYFGDFFKAPVSGKY